MTAREKALEAALRAVLPYMVTSVTACHGDKCRETNCESCFGEEWAQGEVQKAREAGHAANAALALPYAASAVEADGWRLIAEADRQQEADVAEAIFGLRYGNTISRSARKRVAFILEREHARAEAAERECDMLARRIEADENESVKILNRATTAESALAELRKVIDEATPAEISTTRRMDDYSLAAIILPKQHSLRPGKRVAIVPLKDKESKK